MNNFGQREENDFSSRLSMGARAGIVNRTHRVVREQALTMREQKSRTRSLWIPVGICSVLLLVICYAAWFMLDGYDITPSGIPDASDQIMLLVLWSLPVTMGLLGVVWFQRNRVRAASNGEVRR